MPAPISRTRPTAARTGTLNVNTTLNRNKETLHESHREELLDSERVPAQHAKVSVGVGQTINTGDFNSVRIDVRVELPCHEDDVEVTYTRASDLAGACLMNERKLWIVE